MTDQTDNMNSGAMPTPVVHERGGKVTTSSRDVAEMFGKRHADVLRSIDALIAEAPACACNFAFTSERVEMPNGGAREARVAHMDRDGFTLLAMGFTGGAALSFKLAYIGAFNAMEKRLTVGGMVDPIVALNDPATMRGLLLSYSEKVIGLESKVAAMAPTVEAFERIAGTDGLFCVRDAASLLQERQKDLTQFLIQIGWAYRRPNSTKLHAHADPRRSGYLFHKTFTGTRPDGEEWTSTQMMVTAKGLARLAELLTTRRSAA